MHPISALSRGRTPLYGIYADVRDCDDSYNTEGKESGIIPPELDPFTVNRRLLEPVKDIGYRTTIYCLFIYFLERDS